MPFLEDFLIAAEAPTATGTSTINSTAYDCAGYQGIIFIVRLGTTAANNNIRAQEDTVSGMGGAADLASSLVAASTNNIVVIDINRPKKQFVRCQVTRGTSTTIDSLVAIRYGARIRPVTQAGTVSAESYTSPAEGTA